MSPGQEKKLDEIYEMLAGTLEKPGVVHIVNDHKKEIATLKKYKEKDEAYKQKVAGGLFVGIPVFGAIVEWIKYKIMNQS